MKKNAHLSNCRKYRYELWRVWDENKPYVMFVGLNPSTADETEDDPTIRRCVGYAKSWGYGGLCMANLFAFRATNPNDMKKENDPIGLENDDCLLKMAKNAGITIAAWGNDGSFQGRSDQVKKLLSDLHYLKLNKTGEPAHPLYLRFDLELPRFSKL